MFAFTPEERRAIRVLVVLLALGAAWDLWSAARLRARGPLTSDVPPFLGEGIPTADSLPKASNHAPPKGALDLNSAGPEELDTLPGIGPVLAGRIVEFRRANGPFRSLEELRAVRGVGPRLLEKLRPRVTLGRNRPSAGKATPVGRDP